MSLGAGMGVSAGISQSGAAQDATGTLRHMVGMLWYNVLSEMNKTGFSSDALGLGGSNFQDLLLWHVAQNDFGKYDAGLTGALQKQLGHAADGGAASAAAGAVAAMLPQSLLQNLQDLGRVGATMSGRAAAVSAIAASGSASAAAPAQDAGASTDLLTQAKNFALSIWPQITQAAQQLGVPPVAVLAQSALETGWGTAAPGHNLFGIKAADGQQGTMRATQEMQDGVLTATSAKFRDYASQAASISDYVRQIEAGYGDALGQTSVDGFAQALQQGGYATDQNYAAKIVHLSQSPLMARVLQAVGASGSGADAAKAEQP